MGISMNKVLSIILFSVVTLPVCIANAKDMTKSFISSAEKSLQAGDSMGLWVDLNAALKESSGPAAVRRLFDKSPEARLAFTQHIDLMVSRADSMYAIDNASSAINLVASSDVLDGEGLVQLRAKLLGRVESGNLDGSLAFILDSNYEKWDVLKSTRHQAIILERTIQLLREGFRDRPVVGLMRYAASQPIGSGERQRILDLLSTLRIRSDEIVHIEPVYPDFVKKFRESITVEAMMSVQGADRLFEDDLLLYFKRNIRGVQWVSSPDDAVILVDIERVRDNEKLQSEQTTTVTYARHQVGLLRAATLMPDRSSYSYDITTGGAEIDFGYVITITVPGFPSHEELVRGVVSAGFTRCQNPRVTNVFGGVQPAGFMANDEMERLCSGSSSVSMDALRKGVFNRLMDGVLKVKQISRVHELN